MISPEREFRFFLFSLPRNLFFVVSFLSLHLLQFIFILFHISTFIAVDVIMITSVDVTCIRNSVTFRSCLIDRC